MFLVSKIMLFWTETTPVFCHLLGQRNSDGSVPRSWTSVFSTGFSGQGNYGQVLTFDRDLPGVWHFFSLLGFFLFYNITTFRYFGGGQRVQNFVKGTSESNRAAREGNSRFLMTFHK